MVSSYADDSCEVLNFLAFVAKRYWFTMQSHRGRSVLFGPYGGAEYLYAGVNISNNTMHYLKAKNYFVYSFNKCTGCVYSAWLMKVGQTHISSYLTPLCDITDEQWGQLKIPCWQKSEKNMGQLTGFSAGKVSQKENKTFSYVWYSQTIYNFWLVPITTLETTYRKKRMCENSLVK